MMKVNRKVFAARCALITVFLFFAFAAFSQPVDSLTYKIGQMLMIGLPGNKADTSSDFFKEVKNGNVGGLTIYERHLTSENAADNLRTLITAYQAASPIPLFISITQEGGLVNRLKTKYGFPPMPSAEYLGRMNNPDSTKYYADNIAYTLSRLGINLNFAPVLDIYTAGNPVLGDRQRTFSADPALIEKMAEQMIRSHDYFHVNTVVKHFPGHGSSTKDSHLGLVDVSNTWKATELEPYRELMRKGLVKAVMTAHIVNRYLDSSQLPATLSRQMIGKILRGQLGFNGVIFSDDMDMKAISGQYGLKESIEKALTAGVDVLLFSGNIPGQPQITPSGLVALVKELVTEKKISKSRIDESYRRIIALKTRWK